ncbi:hypothetical protein T11_498 [Trichinella zimbabwensis]|uniref:Uncharacterized protein n=1 Tax=Trichinella zimbabwensis TaxID=268475 RepID=A0A0V1GYY6_9BILA|nr:hypothetical protein T11_498 [Trichinella zimbabwensis]
MFSYQNCLGQRAPHQQRTKERELFTRMNDHRLSNGVHFSMAPVALKSDWTVKLTGQPPLTLLPIVMVRGQYNCSSDSIEIVLISAKVGLATALQQAAAALFYWHY